MSLYPFLFEHVLRRIPAEAAHRLAAAALGVAGRSPLRELVRRLLAPRDPALAVEALGLRFPSPVGVAAGVDKEATSFAGLGALGFGFVEVGTITAEGQPGNPKPRVWRLIEDRGLLNAMGFPNPGAVTVAGRLARRRGGGIVGVNVGKGKDTPLADAAADYRASVRELAAFADFIVVNVSSPNTAGLRSLQAVDHLRRILDEVRAELASLGLTRPLLVKLSPDLTDDELDEVADLAVAHGVAGIVTVNTTTSRAGLASEPAILANPGGVSGAPLKPRALEVLRRLHARVGSQVALVSVGGIESAQDVWDRIVAGATLVQGYTGFVYGGPLWPKRLNDELAARVHAAGAHSLQALVGAETPMTTAA
ncbi:MAG TPA: quinone-dependent dihydroorotate dehydrogenase [Solirubrobacteraceae bacterium]|nr:quinone-dependent dihydroorotate dehydrogenase [Solirubrobacteraceae bacterium]